MGFFYMQICSSENNKDVVYRWRSGIILLFYFHLHFIVCCFITGGRGLIKYAMINVRAFLEYDWTCGVQWE